MEFQKITNFLNKTLDDKDLPRFVTKKLIEVYDQSEKIYSINTVRIKTPILRSDLYGFSDAYIVLKGTITVTEPNGVKRNRSIAFKNNAPSINCISKINCVQNLPNIRQILQEILIMFVMVKMVMMKKNLVKMKLKLLFH